MAVYFNSETDENSKKSKAHKQFMESFSKGNVNIQPYVVGIEDIQNPDFGYEAIEDVTRVSREVPDDDDTPKSATELLSNSPSIEDIVLNRVPDPEKPVKDTERQNLNKKYAMAKGVGELVKALSDTFNLTRGGINAQGTQGDIPMVLNNIMQVDQQYADEVKQFRDNLLRSQIFNAGVANDQVKLDTQVAESAKDREMAKGQFEVKLQAEIDKMKNSNDQNQKQRAHEMELLFARLKDNQAERDLGNSRISAAQYEQKIDLLNNQGMNLGKRREQLRKQLETAIDDGEIQRLNAEIAQIDNEWKEVISAYGELTGAKYVPEPQQEIPSGNQMLLDYVLEQQQRPQVSPGSTQVDSATSTEKPSKEAQMNNQVKQEFTTLLSGLQSVSKSQLPTLVEMGKQMAEINGTQWDEKAFISALKARGVQFEGEKKLDKKRVSPTTGQPRDTTGYENSPGGKLLSQMAEFVRNNQYEGPQRTSLLGN